MPSRVVRAFELRLADAPDAREVAPSALVSLVLTVADDDASGRVSADEPRDVVDAGVVAGVDDPFALAMTVVWVCAGVDD